MSFTKSFLGAAATAMILGVASNALAQDCASDKDCPQGFACHASTVANPSTSTSCPPDAPCPKAPDASATTTVVMTCEPKACSDADA